MNNTLRPKRSYGQNFLINESISQRIVSSFLEMQCEKNVLEVGPGKGALTKYLLDKEGLCFKVIEADYDMQDYLFQPLGMDSSQMISGDFLKLALDQVFDNEAMSIVGNFPYNISTQIVFRILKYRDLVPTMVGMFQKEVAERIVSPEGSKAYGIMSVLVQAIYEAKILFHVSPGSFFPAPKVTSSVILLQRKEDYKLPCDESLFKTIVKNSFNQRRKMLRNSLKSLIKDEKLFQHQYMVRRPEQMSLEDYYILTKIIQNQ